MDTYPEIFYTVYKTTCLINGKVYIGVHKTTDPWDQYLGSGYVFQEALNKYGAESFSKEILAVFDNPQDMLDTEARLVTKSFIESRSNYNVKTGGRQMCAFAPEVLAKMSAAQTGKKRSEAHRRAIGEATKLRPAQTIYARKMLAEKVKDPEWLAARNAKIAATITGQKRSLESRQKMSESAKRRWAKV